ncbi:hypothetical protein LCGC14_1319340 [marine sediment metagenome]|uniref:Uncharacterized protein n=1 Tax=marine sediment metagenome TaxID=412755 RepID=A0A0F8VE19_9ZZZZ
MFFQLDLSAIEEYAPFIMMAILILADILILKLGLVVTKANVKTEMKWVAGSFFIQFGLIFFIFTPMVLEGSLGAFGRGFPIELMVVTIIFATFIDLQVINILHQLGIKKSLIIVLLIIGPMSFALFLLADNIGGLLF